MSDTTPSRQRAVTLTCRDSPELDRMDVALVRVTEAISEPYRIVVDALTDNPYDDPSNALGRAASVALKRDGAEVRSFDGVVSALTLMGTVVNRKWFRFVIVPPIAGLALTRRSRCFLTVSSAAARMPRDVLRTTLETALGVPQTSSEFKLAVVYPPMPSALQVDETDLAFFKRTAEAAGIGWFFKKGGKGQAVCCADTFTSYPWLGGTRQQSKVYWAAELTALQLTQRMVTGQAKLNAWDANTATAIAVSVPEKLDAAASVVELFEQPFADKAAGTAMAEARQTEGTAGSLTLNGRGKLASFEPGYVFQYDGPGSGFGAWREDTFLLTQVEHALWQSVPESEGILAAYQREQEASGGALPDGAMGYGNAFVAVSQAGGFRPAQTTPTPRFDGVLRATLCDNAGKTAGPDGKAASAAPYMDAQGRYQVMLPYPAPDGKPGCLFAPLRIMTGFGGSAEVLQMPLRIGTTVYLLFEGGDIDRPIIAGVVAHAGQPTPIPNTVQGGTTTTYLQSVLRTSSGIVVKMTDGSPLVKAQESAPAPKA